VENIPPRNAHGPRCTKTRWLGVVALGDRRKLLRAIDQLAGAASATSQLAPGCESSPRDEAERRQVTVMFADLVGSTALSTGMDPEDLREVISAYQKCVAETVRHFGGFVARYLGDGVLVYFGYPQAHEDDAEQAVRAGLELITAVAGLKTCAPQQVRVGIATGLVVVGHLIASGESEERGIVGETPNLAARLQSIAEPNMVVIAESTRRLLGSFFQLDDLGMRSLKGIAGPVRAWAVVQASSVASRFEALHPTGLTALVGREEEFELLRRRWFKATDGDGQVVLLSGDAGIGKSRLTTAFVELLAGERHIRLRYFCSPQHTDSALYPIIGQMQRAAGLARDDTSQAKLDKLDRLLKQTSTSAQDAALFAEMLSLPNDGRYPAVELTPQQRRQRTLEALLLQADALARSCPVLMVFEDAHWADPTSLELFGRAVDRIRTRSVLLIVTFRPEFEPTWIGQPHVSFLSLTRLVPREVGAVIDHIVGNKSLPANLRQDIIERTDGIPLFVEEMTKAVLETESEGEARRAAALIPSPALAVPAALHASLMARLDRLAPANELAQIGAAIGREFSHPLLAAVVRKPEAELQTALDRLIGAGLLLRQGSTPHATYFFQACTCTRCGLQHAAARTETCASSQNRRNLRKSVRGDLREPARAVGASLHRGRADRESRGAVGQSRTALDVMRELAVQFLALADKQRATGPLMMGHRLMGLSLLHTGDIVDGQAHLDRAIALYDPAEHRPLATRFGQDVGAATWSWKSLAYRLLGYPQAALADAEHALKVAREIGHSATLMYVLNFSAWTHIHCGNYAAANALVDEFSAFKDQTGSLFWGAWRMMQRGCLLALTGKASDAVQTITSGLAAMRSTGTTMWVPLWLSYLTRANAKIGQFGDARRCIGEAMAAVETAKERWCEAEVNRIAGETALLSPEPDLAKAEAYFERALAVAREQQAKSWELRAAMSMARLWRDQGRRSQARDILAPVYGWFTEGFGTLDLRHARAMLDELAQ
jgi:class 3 adenylate cyclase/predicted ATPase